MNTLCQFITFLKEYKKLLERGIKDVLNSNVSNNFIWINDIENFINDGICDATLTDIFSSKFKNQPLVFSLKKPLNHNIQIPESFLNTIKFDEIKNKFESLNEDDEELIKFKTSTEGKLEIEKLKKFKKNKEAYSKLYRAYNDIKNDSNIEIVLSVGFIQYSRLNNNKLSKTNQHLFHFPLSLDIDSNNIIQISFSKSENPYADFFFLNNTPIEKEILSKIIENFDKKVTEYGYEYIFENDFKDLIANSIQKISSNSVFENSINKPESDHFKIDYFKVLYSPAINIKQRKPRFFEKLTDSIINYNNENHVEAKLFNLLIRNPESLGNNTYPKPNYFKDILFEEYKDKVQNLNGEEDFSVFFPLPFNTEQKQIYENYLKNRLTVVTGPPGTGKSHTIVNLLCSLLAQGKRVLVTAQTDKALESLLDKIPQTFDDLIFTKIQLETNQNRFSLEKSIGNISKILTENHYLNVEEKIVELDNLKQEYVGLKSEIIHALENEYTKISINDTFNDLKAYQIIEKFESKNTEEWDWIQDELTNENLASFKTIKEKILKYKELSNVKIRYTNSLNVDIYSILEELQSFNFKEFLTVKNYYAKQLNYLGINEKSKNKILDIQLDNIIQIANEFTNSDIVIDNIKKLENLQQQINKRFNQENFTINKSYSNIIENGTKYLLDIETYLSFAETGKAGFFTKLINSNFKQVAYLEQFTVNGKKCNTKSEILQLKSAIESLIIIHKNFTLLEQNGFSISYDDNSNLQEKYWALNEVLKKIETNKVVVSKIQSDDDFINFSDYTQINLFDIDSLSKKAKSLKKDIEDLKKINHRLIEDLKTLKNIDYKIAQSSLKNEFSDFLPIDEIKSADDYDVIKNKFLEIVNQLEQEKTFLNLKNDLKMLLPNTYVLLKNIPDDFITKENFDFASANKLLNEIEFIDLQKCKVELSFINKKIFQIKSEILFNLAKSNFRNKFDNNEIDSFINLLNSYKFDYSQSLKKGIKDNAKFQIAIRKKSSKISKHLSCWVMKFNDVLNSLEHEPEIFDCIIVDEASQLNFNSVLLSYYSENIIIVGDDKQTSPDASMVDSDSFDHIKDKFLKDFLKDDIIQIRRDTSLFDLSKMVAGRSDLLLKEHFRCVPEIIEFSKFHFYENSLRPLKQISSNRLNPKEMFFVNDAFTENQIVYKEIEAIKEFLQEILKDEQYSNKSIGVVSLGLAKHTEKLKDIKEELANEFGKVKIDKHKLIIEDSPKFQGDERDVMIVSLGVALDIQKLKDNQIAKPRAIVTDQDEFKKINVALSRAKEQMILFHSVKHEHLQTNDFRNKILSFFKDEAKPIPPLVLDDNNEARNRYNVPIPFDSWFEFDIAKSLINNGYSYIQPQYQVKENETYFNPKTGRNSKVHFKIDLVVYNNGKMIAIECDGDPFHSLTEDLAYDIERQEFLERVGWKIYRVLYSAFKRSPQEEIQKIIDYIEKHTKQEEKIIIPKSINLTKKLDNDVDNNEIEESKHVLPKHKSYIDILEENCETPAAIIQSNIGIKKEKHKSYIDILEEELEESNSDILFAKESKILCYFNIYSDNTYILQEQPESNSLFSLPIEEKFKDGYLLQCYDNGHINKVYVNSILKKRMNYHYSKGKEPNAKIVYLKLIEKDEIIALKIKRGLETYFKAHRTENISNRELLHLKGYKVVYQDADKIEYKILPNNISNDINRLIFASFSAEGKSVHNKYYDNEWNIIRKYFKI